VAGAHSRDGAALVAQAGERLDNLSDLAGKLGVDDPVGSYLTPLVGRWSDLHDEAGRWRTAARAAEDVTHRLTSPLGGLDAAWQGKDANSFLDYMQRVGLAGNDLSDAMNAMADALDKTADGIREIVSEMVDLLSDTADQASDAVGTTGSAAGHARAKDLLADLDEPTSQLHGSVGDVLRAFTKLCDNVQNGQVFSAITVSHSMPAQNWAPAPQPPAPTTPSAVPPATPVPHVAQPAVATHPAAAAHTPTVPTPAAHPAAMPSHSAVPSHSALPAAAAHAAAPAPSHEAAPAARQLGPPAESAAVPDPTTGSMSGQLPVGEAAAEPDAASGSAGGAPGGMGMMGGMGGMRGGQGGDQEHKAKIHLSGDVRDILGKPDRTAPPTIGG
jgi:uncharacterized protein YukE